MSRWMPSTTRTPPRLVDVADACVDLEVALFRLFLRLLDADGRDIEARHLPAERREEQRIAPLPHADVERGSGLAILHRLGEELVQLGLLAFAPRLAIVP